MKRGIIERTIKSFQAVTMVCNVNTGETETRCYYLERGAKNKEHALKLVKLAEKEEGIIPVQVIDIVQSEKKYCLSEEGFIKAAEAEAQEEATAVEEAIKLARE